MKVEEILKEIELTMEYYEAKGESNISGELNKIYNLIKYDLEV